MNSEMYDDILVPTDGSDGMAPVFDHAVGLAAEHDAGLHALYAVNTASLADLGIESSVDQVSETLRQEGESALQAASEHAGDTPLETVLVEGSPAKNIVEYAETEGCDVIVMGTHGRSGVDRLLLGSVAERVVRSATVPVLTIRVGTDD